MIGVASTTDTPKKVFDLPPQGALQGAERGMGMGTVGSLRVLIEGPMRVIGSGETLGALIILAASAVTLGSIIGPVYGALAAEPIEKVEQTELALKEALTKLRIQKNMTDHFLARARGKTQYNLIDLSKKRENIHEEISFWAGVEFLLFSRNTS